MSYVWLHAFGLSTEFIYGCRAKIRERSVTQCLKCAWTVLDGVQALIFKAGRRPCTCFVFRARTPSMQRPCTFYPSLRKPSNAIRNRETQRERERYTESKTYRE